MLLSGYLLLLPGSVAAAVCRSKALEPDLVALLPNNAAAGTLSDTLYLPVAIAINLLIRWAIRFYKIKRGGGQ